MTSAGATGWSLTTSAHPAARKTGSRRGRIERIANATKASAARIVAHRGHLKIHLRLIKLLHAFVSPSVPDFRRDALGLPLALAGLASPRARKSTNYRQVHREFSADTFGAGCR